MRFSATILALAATISFAAAQQKCEAQNILDTCIAGYKSRIDTCNATPNDFICLCDAYSDVLVCYNNCPNDANKPSVQNQVTSWCNAAGPLRASASASAASVASVAATQSRAPTSASQTMGVTGSATGAKATASAFFTGGAEAVGVPAGAAVVAVLGALGWF